VGYAPTTNLPRVKIMVIYKRDNGFNAVSSLKIVNGIFYINHGLTKKWRELKVCVVSVTASLVVIKDEFGDDLTFEA
jgi:hypothetical protein